MNKNYSLTQEPNVCAITEKDLKTSALRAKVAYKILRDVNKSDIISWLIDEIGKTPAEAINLYKGGLTYLYLESSVEKDEIRRVNAARLEHILAGLERDIEMKKSERVNAQLKSIDLLNKTYRVYDADDNEKTSGDIEYKITLGGIDKQK